MTFYCDIDAQRSLAVNYDRLNALEDEIGELYDNDPETELGLPPGETNGFRDGEDRILANESHPLYAKIKEHSGCEGELRMTTTKEPLADVKVGDRVVHTGWGAVPPVRLVTISKRTDKRVWTSSHCYNLDGKPIGHRSGWLHVPSPDELNRLESEEAEKIRRQMDSAAERVRLEQSEGFFEARKLIGLESLTPAELLAKYGPARIIAAWKALSEVAQPAAAGKE